VNIVGRNPLVQQHVDDCLDLSDAMARGVLLVFFAGLLFDTAQ
jgi:hypothetical protein